MSKLFFGMLAASLFLASAVRADSIDDILDGIQKNKDARERERVLFQDSTPVGYVEPPTVYNLSFIGGGDAGKAELQKQVWHSLPFGNKEDLGSDGFRRRAVALVIKNNPIHIADDGPSIKLQEFWMQAADSTDGRSLSVRVKPLENKSFDSDSLPGKRLIGRALQALTRNLNIIANFYGTYDLHPVDIRVHFLDKRQYVDSVRVKAITNDNTSNYRGKLDVHVLYE